VYLCVSGALQMEITGADVAVECRDDAGAGIQSGRSWAVLVPAERCERPPRRLGRARRRAGEATELLGEASEAGAVQKVRRHRSDSATCPATGGGG
jgi:hypothetical protein